MGLPERVQEERPGREQAQVARRVLEPEPGPAAHQEPVEHRARAVQQGLLRAGRVAQVDWGRAGRS